MRKRGRTSHALSGFPAAASTFVGALDGNRQRIARDAGLTGSELKALFHVARVVSTTPKKLATYLGMTTGAVTAISRRLVELGIFHRVDHPDDRRSLYLELTPHGHTVMSKLHGEFTEMLTDSTSSLTADELQIFTAALVTVANEVKRRSEQP